MADDDAPDGGAEMWGPGSLMGQEAPKAADQDKINAGAGPIGELMLGAAAGGATSALRATAGEALSAITLEAPTEVSAGSAGNAFYVLPIAAAIVAATKASGLDTHGPSLFDTLDAMEQGHSWDDIADHVGRANMPDRPSVAELFGGGSLIGQEAPKRSDQDAINEGAGPVGEFLLGAAAGGAASAVRGAIRAGVLADVSGELAPASARAAALGVNPTADALTDSMSEMDFAARDALDALNKTVGNKWVRRGAGTAASQGAFWNPGGTGYNRRR